MELSGEEKRNTNAVLDGLVTFNEMSKELEHGATSIPSHGARNSETNRQAAVVDKIAQPFLDGLAPDILWTSLNGEIVQGRQAVYDDLKLGFHTWPGMQAELPPREVVPSCNNVFILYVVGGQNTNGFMGLPPTDKPFKFSIAAFNTFNSRGKRTKALFVTSPLEVYFELGFPRFSITGKPGESSAPCLPLPGEGHSARPRPADHRDDGAESWFGGSTRQPYSVSPRSPGNTTDTMIRFMVEMSTFPFQLLSKSFDVILSSDRDRKYWKS